MTGDTAVGQLLALTRDDIRRAYDVIGPYLRRTPAITLDLGRGGHGGHEDPGRDAQLVRGIRDGDAVVAARGCRHTSGRNVVTPPWQSAAMVIVGGATVALLPVSGRLVDRFGARPFLSGGFLLAGMALVLFAAQTRYLPALMFMIALGSAYAMILPSWNSLLDRSVDAAKRGAMWGVFMTVEGLGTAVGPLIGGRLWQSVGPRAPFLFSAFLVCSMGVIYTFLRLPGLRRSLRTRTEWT